MNGDLSVSDRVWDTGATGDGVILESLQDLDPGLSCTVDLVSKVCMHHVPNLTACLASVILGRGLEPIIGDRPRIFGVQQR